MESGILDVTSWVKRDEEWLGDQEKLWLREPGGRSLSWLFKPSRVTKMPGRGAASERAFTWFDAQSELIAAELAQLIDVPTAKVRMARRSGDRRRMVARSRSSRLLPPCRSSRTSTALTPSW